MERKYYIRFGDIPEGEVSQIYKGDTIVGKEAGVSVYDSVCIDREWRVVMPRILTSALGFDLYGFIDNERPIYLVTGDEVGTGTTNEPVLKNVKIIKQLK